MHMFSINGCITLLYQNSMLHITFGKQPLSYRLTGVVAHHRISQTMAHYTAFVSSLKESRQWFHADDSQVHVHTICSVHIIIYRTLYK